MNRKFAIGAVVLVVVGAVFGGLFGRLSSTISADSSVTAGGIVADYTEALAVIDKQYVGKLDHEKLADSSIQSMIFYRTARGSRAGVRW